MKLKCFALSLLLLAGAAGTFAQARTLPETRNAALRYWQAFAEIKDPPSEKSTLELMEKTLAGQAVWNEGKLAAILDANRIALGIFLRATSLPDCDWGLEYRRGPDASIAIVPRASVMARLNSLEAMRDMATGNKSAAVERWIAGIRFSQDLAHGGSLIFALTAKSALMINMRALSAEAKNGHFSQTQKKRLLASINGLPEDGFDWGTTWGIEQATIEVAYQHLQDSKNPSRLDELMMDEAPSPGCIPPSEKEIRAFREYMFAVQAALRDSPANSKSRIDALEPMRKKLCPNEQSGIPSAQQINIVRMEVASARQALLAALNEK